MNGLHLIKDEIKKSQTQFLSFKGSYHRYDIAIITTDDNPNEKMILDLNGNRFSYVSKEKIKKEGFVEHVFNFNEMEAEEFRSFILEIL